MGNANCCAADVSTNQTEAKIINFGVINENGSDY